MQKIVDAVRAGRVLVSDGAWGTMMQSLGMGAGDCPELWNIDRRGDVLGIARGYIEAGSDMVETNSFGANVFKLALFGLEARVAELNEAAAAISREAAGPDRHVLGSMGPTGKMLLMGEVTEDQVYETYREQARALERGGADACCIETMSDVAEASLAVKAARENTDLEVACTMTFEKGVSGEYRTMMGVSPDEATGTLLESGAQVVGANCGNGMAGMIEVVRQIRAVAGAGVPILVHANAGLPKLVAGRTVFDETPEQMAGLAEALIEAGAGIVGGCCGTTPAHIAALAVAVRKLRE